MIKIFIKKIFGINFKDIFNVSYSDGWIGLIIFFLLLNISLATFNLFLYIRIDNNQAFVISNEEKEEITHISQINKNKLNKTIDIFNKKSEDFESLKKVRVDDIVDPSIFSL